MEQYLDFLVDTETQRVYNLDGTEVRYHMVCGYVSFCNNIRVHRVIALLCVPNDDPEHKTDVHHIDGNKLNNRPDNLVWMSRSEHQRYHAQNRGPETIEKIRKSLTGYKHTEEARKNMSAAFMGHPVSQATREKIGKANSGAKNGMFGYKYTEEELRKRSEKQAKPVVMLGDGNEPLRIFLRGATEAGKALNVASSGITRSCRSQYRKSAKHRWRYATDEEIMEFNFKQAI